MHLKPNDLRQLDAERIRQLRERDPDALAQLSERLLDDLKEAHERLNQSSRNSSRPPSSRPPWEPSKGAAPDDLAAADTDPEASPEEDAGAEEKAVDEDSDLKEKPGSPKKRPKKNRCGPGKQKGAPGAARTQVIPVTDTQPHYSEQCACCGKSDLPQEQAKAYTAFGVLGVELGGEGAFGLGVTYTWHTYYETPCACGHVNRAEPYRAPPDEEQWDDVALTEWRLIGPSLAGLLVWLRLRMRLSARLTQEFLLELLGIELSVGAIHQSLLESARAADPVQEQILKELIQHESQLLHGDETSHPQAGEPLWLWTLVGCCAAIFAIGPRSKAMFERFLGGLYTGWLMTDGYRVYRDHPKRLRCWAHLLRKAQGLAESFSTWPVYYGRETLRLLKSLQAAVYAARETASVPASVRNRCQGELDSIYALCERMKGSTHQKTRALAVEFLNDWNAIFRVLDHPHLPLTNNEAERTLRSWVILRRITYGTRTPQGSLALSIFASVIETCRKRGASPLRYLQQLIAAGRSGAEIPPLPPVRACG
jgi:IS1 family transposase